MVPHYLGLVVLAVFIAGPIGTFAQAGAAPTGNWQSTRQETYTNPLHPVLTGAELFLNIDVSNDGSFRGEWGEYFCTGSIGAFGVGTFSCRYSRSSGGRASGRFGPAGQGVMELEKLGQTSFSWSTTANELAIDLPRNWRNADPMYHRARLTRDGAGKPAAVASRAREADEPLLSGPALYREFVENSYAAAERYKGRTLVLEGRRGTLIPLHGGGAAIHVPDGFTRRALVLLFRDLRQVSDIGEGAQFRFRCTLEDFAYQYLHLNDCSIVR